MIEEGCCPVSFNRQSQITNLNSNLPKGSPETGVHMLFLNPLVQLGLILTGIVTPIDRAATATVELKGFPDFLAIGHGSLWVSNPGLNLIQRVDLDTGKVVAEV